MSLKLYNYYKRKIEVFTPIIQNRVGMYVCGPTVYGTPHLGHARSAIVFDTLYRYLHYLGYSVRYARNITDVGHLEDEVQEQGEDKLIRQSKLEKKEPMELSQFYAGKYHQALQYLNVLHPSVEPLATGHVPEQIEYIEQLMEHGAAYTRNNSVYFDMQYFLEKYKEIYGTLSGVSVEKHNQTHSMYKGEKKSPLDFALWKKANSNHLMHWRSPWSKHGFPGWHTECAAMSAKYLGVPFDIHGGGIDLQFPHHEAEIAQSYVLHNTLQANYWVYNNLITIERQKMSKSLGNFVNLDDCFTGNSKKLSKAHDPNVIRFFLLRSHYRSVLDFTDDALQGNERGLQKILHLLRSIKQKVFAHVLTSVDSGIKEEIPRVNNGYKDSYQVTNLWYDEVQQKLVSALERIKEKKEKAGEFLLELERHMNNDLDTPAVIATLFSMDKYIEKLLEEEKEDIDCKIVFYVFCTVVLGLRIEEKNTLQHTHLIDVIVKMRTKAREEKNYILSDYLRDVLSSANVVIKDRKDGTSYWEM